MKVVIVISKELYKALCSRDYFVTGMRSNKTVLLKLIGAIRKGTVLPKGHGRLIDADIVNEILNSLDGCTAEIDKAFNVINEAPTVVEADRDEE